VLTTSISDFIPVVDLVNSGSTTWQTWETLPRPRKETRQKMVCDFIFSLGAACVIRLNAIKAYSRGHLASLSSIRHFSVVASQ
jgi:hypothetical protein